MELVCVYRDSAYPLGLHLQALFRKMQFTPQMVLYYKKAMSKLQVAVEWPFGRIGNYFKFIDFKNPLQVNECSGKVLHSLHPFMQNAPTCLYGNIV